jgi:hypothetical protein
MNETDKSQAIVLTVCQVPAGAYRHPACEIRVHTADVDPRGRGYRDRILGVITNANRGKFTYYRQPSAHPHSDLCRALEHYRGMLCHLTPEEVRNLLH